MLSIICKVLSVMFKVITAGIFTFDMQSTRKLLAKNKYAQRSLSALQKVEVVGVNVIAYLQILLPLTLLGKAYYSTIIQFVIMIITYIHLNRWLFIGKNVIVCRCEVFDTRRIIKPVYDKKILRFKSGNREFIIHHPLNSDERIKKYI